MNIHDRDVGRVNEHESARMVQESSNPNSHEIIFLSSKSGLTAVSASRKLNHPESCYFAVSWNHATAAAVESSFTLSRSEPGMMIIATLCAHVCRGDQISVNPELSVM